MRDVTANECSLETCCLLISVVIFSTHLFSCISTVLNYKHTAVETKRDTTKNEGCKESRVGLGAFLEREMQSGAADLKEVCQLGVAVGDVGLLGGQG